MRVECPSSWFARLAQGGARVLLLAALFLGGGQAAAQAISQQASAQIQALLAEKDARTPAQRKLDSNLLYAVKMNRGEGVAPGVSALQTGIDTGADAVEVDISARRVDETLLGRIEELGGALLHVSLPYRTLRARVPFASLETLAAEPSIVFIEPKQLSVTQRAGAEPAPPAGATPGVAARAARVRRQLAPLLAARGLAALGRSALGDVIANKITGSQGDVTHRANLARGTFGATGAGIKIGVISDGVNSLAALQASGDLPAVTVLPGQAGSGNEGAAMLEIVYDLAPGAQLYFATANPTITQFAQNIRDLRTAGCDIIVDDVFYFVETPFQKGQAPSVVSPRNGGVVVQAVADVTAAGALYFSSAGNSGNVADGTAGAWEGDFVDGGAVAVPVTGTGNLHSFGATAYDTVTAVGLGIINLHWSDPLGGSANDYDLFVLDSTGASVLASSTNVQTGTQDPYEQISSGVVVNARVVVVKRTGAAARFLHLNSNRGRLAVATGGQTHGHATVAATGAYGVAATPAVGPYPGPFSGSNVSETFSSDGPRRLLFNADGSAITPGNVSSTGGTLIQKPDITAADGVSCSAPGFSTFFGTSAAAPHAAAIAGLLKSAVPSLTQAQVRTILTSTAIDIEAPGPDTTTGSGILDAFAALQASGASPQATLLAGVPVVTETAGNLNGILEPGECGSITVPLTNGNATIGATAISATLSTATAGVTIDAATSAYPDVAGGATATNVSGFKFHTSNTVSCPLTINFTLTTTFTGGTSPAIQVFQVRVGSPPVSVTTNLDATSPPASAAYVAATGTQTGRLFRDGVASACGTAKANPGLTAATGSRAYDAYTFVACQNSCINVNVAAANGGNLYTAAYLGSFVPANPSTNFLADAGSSSTSASYSFNVTAGQTFVVVVHDINVTPASGSTYTMTVDGACLPCATYTNATCPSACPPPPPALVVTAPAFVGQGSPNRVASIAPIGGATYVWGITNGTITAGQGTNQVTFTAGTAGTPTTLTVNATVGGCPAGGGTANVTVLPIGSSVQFYAVTPCRMVDTRDTPGPSGGPALVAGGPDRSFPLVNFCGIPSGAAAVSANVTVVASSAPGNLAIYRGDGVLPGTSTINFSPGQTRANNAVLQLALDGTGVVKVHNASTASVHLVLDVNGYFQ